MGLGGGGGIQGTHGVQGWDVGHPPLFESKHTGREERKWSDLTDHLNDVALHNCHNIRAKQMHRH